MPGVIQFGSNNPCDTELHEEAACYVKLGLRGQTLWAWNEKAASRCLGYADLSRQGIVTNEKHRLETAPKYMVARPGMLWFGQRA
jgi:hypothetical protein